MKVIINGLIAGVIMLFTSLLLSSLYNIFLPGLTAEYKNSCLFRPWSDPIMSLIFVHPLFQGLILAWLWSKIKQVLTGSSIWDKGLSFGLIFWIVTLPGMIISYGTFPVSLGLVAAWTLSGLLETIFAGLYLSRALR